MSSPFIVNKSKFAHSQSKEFNSYIDYIDREEAKRDKGYNNYSLYNEYMSNEMKSTGLFSDAKSNLSEDEKKKMKDLFKTAQKNNSVLWQDVFSFNNKKLEEQGFYNSKTKALDEEAIREATCNAMNYLLEEDNLKDSAIWTASIHHNTDNIHVHIAICEPIPSRNRGKRKQKTLDKMKSKFANTLLDYDKNYTKINEVIRENIIGQKKDIKQFNKTLNNDVHLKKLYKKAIENLPKDKKQWAYNYNTMKESRVYLDKIAEHYLKNYKKKEYKDLLNLLDEQQENLLYTYGEGKHNKYKNYKKNKIEDLYKRMGNSTLKEIKILLDKENKKHTYIELNKGLGKERINNLSNSNFEKQINTEFDKGSEKKGLNDLTNSDIIDKHNSFKINKISKYENNNSNATSNKNKLSKIYINNKDVNNLKKELGNKVDSFKNQLAFERLQKEIEYSR